MILPADQWLTEPLEGVVQLDIPEGAWRAPVDGLYEVCMGREPRLISRDIPRPIIVPFGRQIRDLSDMEGMRMDMMLYGDVFAQIPKRSRETH